MNDTTFDLSAQTVRLYLIFSRNIIPIYRQYSRKVISKPRVTNHNNKINRPYVVSKRCNILYENSHRAQLRGRWLDSACNLSLCSGWTDDRPIGTAAAADDDDDDNDDEDGVGGGVNLT